MIFTELGGLHKRGSARTLPRGPVQGGATAQCGCHITSLNVSTARWVWPYQLLLQTRTWDPLLGFLSKTVFSAVLRTRPSAPPCLSLLRAVGPTPRPAPLHGQPHSTAGPTPRPAPGHHLPDHAVPAGELSLGIRSSVARSGLRWEVT